MIHLPKARDAWNSPGFDQALKDELEAIDGDQLPLQQGLSLSSMVSSEPFGAIVIDSEEYTAFIRCRVSIIYAGIIAGCSCADDPTPLDTQTEYCELLLEIDKGTAETRVKLIDESH
ncbi:MAG: hypothetical protein ABW161_16615 [Candidatus Thiodiazotropha sp.]